MTNRTTLTNLEFAAVEGAFLKTPNVSTATMNTTLLQNQDITGSIFFDKVLRFVTNDKTIGVLPNGVLLSLVGANKAALKAAVAAAIAAGALELGQLFKGEITGTGTYLAVATSPDGTTLGVKIADITT